MEVKKNQKPIEANVVNEKANLGDGEDMLLVSTNNKSTNNKSLSDCWILDSRCSYYMCPYKEWFDTYKSCDASNVLIGNDASYKAIGIGTIKIKMYDGIIITLGDVKHVPKLKKFDFLGNSGFSGLWFLIQMW